MQMEVPALVGLDLQLQGSGVQTPKVEGRPSHAASYHDRPDMNTHLKEDGFGPITDTNSTDISVNSERNH